MFSILYITAFFSILFSNQSPQIDNYHTYQEVQTKLNDWDDLYGNNDNPQPSYYSNSGIIYKLEQIGFSNVNGVGDIPSFITSTVNAGIIDTAFISIVPNYNGCPGDTANMFIAVI